ncbi:hypothetical protein C8R44DRAFT_906454, partial [Mycena epipterygia]
MTVLLRVARRVKIWIEPVLYRILRIVPPRFESPMSLSTHEIPHLIESRPPSFFHAHVRHLCRFLDSKYLEVVMGLVALCDATSNLQLLGSSRDDIPPLLGALPLQRLSAKLSSLFPNPSGPNFSHRLRARITHLDFHGFEGCAWANHSWETWSGLAQMLRLTHLSFHNNGQDYAPIYQGVLLHCKSLQVVAAFFTNVGLLLPFVPDYATIATDPRFVMLVTKNIILDWEIGARGGEDRWIRADELVRRRRSGEMKTSGSPVECLPQSQLYARIFSFFMILAHSTRHKLQPNYRSVPIREIHAALAAGAESAPCSIQYGELEERRYSHRLPLGSPYTRQYASPSPEITSRGPCGLSSSRKLIFRCGRQLNNDNSVELGLPDPTLRTARHIRNLRDQICPRRPGTMIHLPKLKTLARRPDVDRSCSPSALTEFIRIW